MWSRACDDAAYEFVFYGVWRALVAPLLSEGDETMWSTQYVLILSVFNVAGDDGERVVMARVGLFSGTWMGCPGGVTQNRATVPRLFIRIARAAHIAAAMIRRVLARVSSGGRLRHAARHQDAPLSRPD